MGELDGPQSIHDFFRQKPYCVDIKNRFCLYLKLSESGSKCPIQTQIPHKT